MNTVHALDERELDPEPLRHGSRSTRPLESRIAAWVSPQIRPLTGRVRYQLAGGGWTRTRLAP